MNGGDARQRRETERGRFGANLFGTEPPRSVLGGFADRAAPDLAELSAQGAKQRDADEQPPQTATRARWHKQGQL